MMLLLRSIERSSNPVMRKRERSSNPVMHKNLSPVNLCIYRGHQFGPPKKFFRGKILEEASDVMPMLIECERGVLIVTDNYGIGFDYIITARNMIYV